MSARLPFTLTPLPGEPFGLWWHTYASSLQTTSRDLAHAVGLPPDTPPRLEHAEAIAAATRLPKADIAELFASLRPTPHAHVLRVWTALSRPTYRHDMPARVTDLLDRLRDPAATSEGRARVQDQLTDLTLIALHLTQPGIRRLHGFTHQLPAPAAFTAAIDLHDAPAAAGGADRLTALVASATDHGRTPGVPFSWRTASPALTVRIARCRDTLISPAERLRYATTLPAPTPRPRRHGDPAMARATRMPSQLWPGWAIRLIDDDSINNTVFRPAMTVALLLPHSSRTLGQFAAMLPTRLQATSVGHQLRRLAETPNGTTALRVLTELALALDEHPVPIDYPRRRALATATELIDAATWQRYCRHAQLRPGQARRLTHVRRYLYELLTGDSLAHAPQPYQLPRGGYDGVEYLEFWAALPARLVATLHRHAEQLLTAAGVTNEPLSWEPPTEWVSLTRWPGADPDQTDPAPIHQALRAQWVTDIENHWAPGHATAAALGISAAHLNHVLRRHPLTHGPYTPHRAGTVLPLTAGSGPRYRSQPQRRGQKPIFHVDPDWLRDQRAAGRTLAHIATEIGCTYGALRTFAIAHGMPQRPRKGYRQTHLPAHALTCHPADLPELLRAALTRQRSSTRLERLLYIAEQPSLNQAARSIGVVQSALTIQLKSLERACGGPLFHRQHRRRPLGPLTPLGEQLCQQIRDYLVLNS